MPDASNTTDLRRGAAGSAAFRPDVPCPVFLVGGRFAHHAAHSGYERFGPYVGTLLRPPVAFRWTVGRWGWRLSQLVGLLARHEWYTPGAHLTEWSTLAHMLRHQGCIYHYLYADFDLWLLRRAHRWTGNHLVASFHQPEQDLRRFGFAPRVAGRADAVVVVSATQRPYFEEFLPRERVFVVPVGIDTEYFQPAAQPANTPVGITIGSHRRDFATLAQALHLIWEVEPDFRFLAVGTRSNNHDAFPALDDPRIRFLDGIGDAELLAACQNACVALFSLRESTANIGVLEAMASGLPVVATNTGGIPEYLPREAGGLCPPADPEALAAATLRILGDRDLRARAGSAARARAEQLDYRVVAGLTAEVYQRVAGSSG